MSLVPNRPDSLSAPRGGSRTLPDYAEYRKPVPKHGASAPATAPVLSPVSIALRKLIQKRKA